MSLALLALCVPGTLNAATPLERAYTQEMTLLQDEKRALQQRIVEAREIGKTRADALRAQVDELSEQLTVVRIENEELDARLAHTQDVTQVGQDRTSLLEGVQQRARALLRKHGVHVAHGRDRQAVAAKAAQANVEASALADLFAATAELTARLGGMRVEQQTYFAADGTQHHGEVLRISGVAAIALDERHGGALAPVTGGLMGVVEPSAALSASQWVAGTAGPSVGLFLFDPLEKNPVTGEGPRSLLQTFVAGGYLMWPILLLGLVGLAILAERSWALWRVHANTAPLLQLVGTSMTRGQWHEATTACAQHRGAVSQVLEMIIENRGLAREQLEDLVAESIVARRSTLERFLPVVNVIAVVSPLLGLLGTVTGMIATFAVITDHGTGDPRLLSGGISEALLTTQFGLMVAIPALLAHALLVGRVDRIVAEMESAALQLLNRLQCKVCGFAVDDCDHVSEVDDD